MDLPVFLVASPEISIDEISEVEDVRITWDEFGWYIISAYHQRHLFSFDLPAELFELYAEAGVLSPLRALDLKQDFLSDIQANLVSQNRIRLLHFRLDHGWLEQVRVRVKQTSQPTEAQIRRLW